MILTAFFLHRQNPLFCNCKQYIEKPSFTPYPNHTNILYATWQICFTTLLFFLFCSKFTNFFEFSHTDWRIAFLRFLYLQFTAIFAILLLIKRTKERGIFMNNLFNPDNKFFAFMGKVADLMILNLLCIVCCLPIVTAGASITALYYVTLKIARNEETYIARGFFHSFKENFKQATIIHLIMIVLGALLIFDLYFVRVT